MPVIADGPLSRPFQLAAILLASSATFRALVGAADEDAALAFIDFPYRDIETVGYQIPGAILTDDDSLIQFRARLGEEAGKLALVVSAPIPDQFRGGSTDQEIANNQRDDSLDWRNTLGAILMEMLAHARAPRTGGGFYWHLVRWTKVQIGWCQQSEKERDGSPDDPPNFRIGVFILDWV
jgi:hypothetical protein